MSIFSAHPKSVRRARIPYQQEYYEGLQYEPDPVAGYRLRGNQRLPHVTVNADGYRGRPFAGTETILLLGDSVTFGVGASSDAMCFARFLESYTGQGVADASVRGYRASQHFAKLPVLLDRLPDTRSVLLWCGYVDLIFWIISGGRKEGVFQFAHTYQPDAFHHQVMTKLKDALKRITAAGPYVQRGASKPPLRPAPQGKDWREDLEELAHGMVIYIRAIRDVLEVRGIKLQVAIQPFVRNQPTGATLRHLIDGYDEKTHEKFGAGWYDIATYFVVALHRWLAELRTICWMDCQSLVSEEDFFDQVHLREDSIRRIARGLAAEVAVAPRELAVVEGQEHAPPGIASTCHE